MTKTKEYWRLLLFVAVVLLVPAIVSHLLPIKEHFDAGPIARLRARQPAIVILSDSMVDNGIDSGLLEEKLGGRRVELLWYGSSESASWYLRLKNYIVASGIHPELVCIAFRDRILTDPSFRTEGTYRSKLEASLHANDPVYRLVLGNDSGGKNKLERWITAIYPLNASRHVEQEKVERMSLRTLANLGTTVNELGRRVNETFAIANLRGGAIEEAVALSKEEQTEFNPDPRRSFLPHMVAVAAEAHIPLCFFRVRRYPGPDNRVAQNEQLQKYVADLRKWIESHGCSFIDDTENFQRTPDMYLKPGDDHIGPWAKQRSTELYADELRSLLSP
jgi:hypothetical protein